MSDKMYGSNYLFNTGDLRNFLQEQKESALREIKDKNSNYILNINVPDYSKYLVEKYTLAPPILQEEKISIDSNEVEIDVSRDPSLHFRDSNKPYYVTGTKITLYIPFEGDSVLFKYKPSRSYVGQIFEGTLVGQEIHVPFSFKDKTSEFVNNGIDRQIGYIKDYLGFVEKDVRQFNNSISQAIEQQIISRREKLLRDNNLVSALGFPLRERSGMPTTYSVPTIRKSIPKPPVASTESFVPEPALDMENYEHILNVVSNMTLVMERSPKAFKDMGEEDIRQHFLVQLNGHYEGQATGETFNYQGKTDILIRENGKNIFISECKFWKGGGVFKETIDQILGYLSWRDTKTAIFIFNRNKDLSNVLSQIPGIVKEHPNFKKEIKYNSETGFRFILGHNNDSNREIYLTILVFDVPK